MNLKNYGNQATSKEKISFFKTAYRNQLRYKRIIQVNHQDFQNCNQHKISDDDYFAYTKFVVSKRHAMSIL